MNATARPGVGPPADPGLRRHRRSPRPTGRRGSASGAARSAGVTSSVGACAGPASTWPSSARSTGHGSSRRGHWPPTAAALEHAPLRGAGPARRRRRPAAHPAGATSTSAHVGQLLSWRDQVAGLEAWWITAAVARDVRRGPLARGSPKNGPPCFEPGVAGLRHRVGDRAAERLFRAEAGPGPGQHDHRRDANRRPRPATASRQHSRLRAALAPPDRGPTPSPRSCPASARR